MSMLADRRERKRYNLVPRGKALYEDGNRFGTRMLEKMGWSKGKGLGAKEDGDKEFVRIRYKHDNEGLGFEDRDDQWTQHENEFNGLLKTLGGESGSENNSQDAVDEVDMPASFGFGFQMDVQKIPENIAAISGESLEEKSKKSKARVHYKKFTRGKDISRYSEKELANIFGKKSFGTSESPQIPEFNQSKPPSQETSDSDEAARFGVTTISTGTSIADYFKAKMEKLSSKLKIGGKEGQENGHEAPACNGEEAEADDTSVKSKKKKKKPTATVEGDVVSQEGSVESNKSKKRKRQDEIQTETIQDVEEQPKEKRKKSKKAKTETDSNENEELGNVEDQTTESSNSENCTETVDSSAKLKPKKPKRKSPNIQEIDEADLDHLNAEIKPKKTKRKSPTAELSEGIDEQNADGVETEEKSKQTSETGSGDAESKPKKSKRKSQTAEMSQVIVESSTNEVNVEIDQPIADSHDPAPKPKKSKRKSQTIEADQEIVESNAEIKSKKSKRKSKSLESSKTEIEFPTNDDAEKQPETQIGSSKPPFSKPPRNIVPTSLSSAVAKAKSLEKVRAKEQGNETRLDTALSSKQSDSEKNKSDENASSSPSDREADAETNSQVQISSTSSAHSQTVPNQFRFPELNLTKKSKKAKLLESTLATSEIAAQEKSDEVSDPNAFNISGFKAEYFYNIDSDAFAGSNFSKIIGYGLTSDIKLQIKENNADNLKIRRLYGKVFDKYAIHREGTDRRRRPNSSKKRSMFVVQV